MHSEAYGKVQIAKMSAILETMALISWWYKIITRAESFNARGPVPGVSDFLC